MIRIGIIAEDASDVDVMRELIGKIKRSKMFCIRRFVGDGCGKIRSKCRDWAHQLHLRGCSALIVVHDLDRRKLSELQRDLATALNPCPIVKHAIIIPIEEIEAWLMCDAAALRRTFSLTQSFNLPNNPEKVASPKEKLESLIWLRSGKTRRYINAVHNVAIARQIPLHSLRKCRAFAPFERFVENELN